MSPGPGRLAVVLHSHMPYVEGFGTWPFGEEWLWEAIATSYLPLLELLDAGAPLTLSMTPVLADQLEAPGALERCAAFLRDVRPASHGLDAEAAHASGEAGVARELERAAGDYARALSHLEALDGDLLGALGAHCTWTSAATHAVLPLLATTAGVRLQLRTGIEAHRARWGAWGGGFWLPECAHAPWLDPLLEEAGARASCVDLTDVLGRGDERHLRPIATPAGPLLVPIDREIVELVWSREGYPAHKAYRDSHHRTARDHRPWANDGSVYDPARAAQRSREDAADFVARCRERVAGGGLAVCALDTELLGHWWHEGVTWLGAVVEEAAAQGLEMARLDDALEETEPARPPPGADRVTTWGTPRDLSTWSGPQVADLATAARDAELRIVAAGAAAPERAIRELLAVQTSDWAFQATNGLAGDYPRERAAAHLQALNAALAAGVQRPRGGGAPVGSAAGDPLDPSVRNLAPRLPRAALLEP